MNDLHQRALLESVRRQALLSEQTGGPLPRQMQFGAGGEDRYPAVHEQQIDRYADGEMARQRRVDAHARRVDAELRSAQDRVPPPVQAARPGKARAVLCVERDLVFKSVASAARYVQRAPSNIIQSIRFGYRCGDYHWSYAEPDRQLNSAGSEPAACAVASGASRQGHASPVADDYMI